MINELRFGVWGFGFGVLGPVKTRVETSLVRHLVEEVWGLGREAGVGAAGAVQDVKREVVYNTMFHVPWRCELVRSLGVGGGRFFLELSPYEYLGFSMQGILRYLGFFCSPRGGVTVGVY